MSYRDLQEWTVMKSLLSSTEKPMVSFTWPAVFLLSLDLKWRPCDCQYYYYVYLYISKKTNKKNNKKLYWKLLLLQKEIYSKQPIEETLMNHFLYTRDSNNKMEQWHWCAWLTWGICVWGLDEKGPIWVWLRLQRHHYLRPLEPYGTWPVECPRSARYGNHFSCIIFIYFLSI